MNRLKKTDWITILKKADWINCFAIIPFTAGCGVGSSLKGEFIHSLGFAVLFCGCYCTHSLYKRTIRDLDVNRS